MWDSPEKTKKIFSLLTRLCNLSKAELNTPNEISFCKLKRKWPKKVVAIFCVFFFFKFIALLRPY